MNCIYYTKTSQIYVVGASMKRSWWKEAVVYQIYPRSFRDSNGDGIGDLQGIIEKLDYLSYLGINAIWLNPVYKSPNDDNGYDISDYLDIMEEFGSMKDFDQLLAAVHEKGMRLIMDLVVNHTSDEHPWFLQSSKSPDNPYRDYYFWRTGEKSTPPNNWQSFFEGPAWQYDDATSQWYLHLFTRKQPDLNWDNPKVRDEVREIIRFWLKKGVDGFRMDVINLISKRPGLPDGTDSSDLLGHEHFANGPRIHEYLRFVQESLGDGDVMTVGETVIADLDTVAGYVDEKEGSFNMAINFEHVTLDRDKGSFDPIPLDLQALKGCFSRWQKKLDGRGWNCLYLSNHDQPRQVSRFGEDANYHRESATMLATLLHSMQGTPFIMQGEEIGMTNVDFPSIGDYRDIATLNYYREQLIAGENPESILERVRQCSRDNARTPMQWNDQDYAGFSDTASWIGINTNFRTINVKSEIEDPDSILNYYRQLIKLRREYPVFVYGDFTEIHPEHLQVFSYRRRFEGTELLAVLNLSGKECSFSLPDGPSRRLLIGNYTGRRGITGTLTLRPYEAMVLIDDMRG
jgi:oligo-1,6-glucosidase